MSSGGDTQTQGRRRWVALGGLGVSLGTAALALPWALLVTCSSPDTVAHLATPYSWLHGEGWVEMWRWNYYLDGTVPHPGFAVRAPIVSLLAAVPLALGATPSTISGLHALFASFVAGLFVPVAARFMRPLSAVAAALLIAWSPAWIILTQYVWTEVTAAAAFLLVLTSSRGVLRSRRGALLCALATVIAWLTRPNLGLLAVVVAVALALELGPRRAIRHGPLWVYIGAFGLSLLAIFIAMVETTGYRPYEAYGAMSEILDWRDGANFQKEYVGIPRFMVTHWNSVVEVTHTRARQLWGTLFVADNWLRIGWLGVAGVFHSLLRRGSGSLERRFCALTAVGMAIVVIGTYGAFDKYRYPAFVAIPMALCGIALLDDIFMRLGSWLLHADRRRAAATLGLAPLALALASITQVAHIGVPVLVEGWRGLRDTGHVGELGHGRAERRLCQLIHKDAIVATDDPWQVTYWCGNLALQLPVDLDQELESRFLDEQHPGYLAVRGQELTRWLDQSPRLRRVIARPGLVLYEVVDAGPDSRPWNAPPPLACAGHGPECTRTSTPDEPGATAVFRFLRERLPRGVYVRFLDSLHL